MENVLIGNKLVVESLEVSTPDPKTDLLPGGENIICGVDVLPQLIMEKIVPKWGLRLPTGLLLSARQAFHEAVRRPSFLKLLHRTNSKFSFRDDIFQKVKTSRGHSRNMPNLVKSAVCTRTKSVPFTT